MIVDSSAVAAICLGESDAEQFVDLLEGSEDDKMSAATYLESAIVIDSRRPGAFDLFITATHIEIVPVNQELAEVARIAYRNFGKGSGHAAALNFGDCFAYALAISLNEPLIYKGADFSHTDVRSGLHPEQPQ